MKARLKIRWMVVLSFFLILSTVFLGRGSEAQRGRVGTQTCTNCHITWEDNNPPLEDMILGRVNTDYLPLNLAPSHAGDPFYTIPEGFVASIHSSDDTDPFKPNCEDCHGTGLAHFGIGSIPRPIPQISTCGGCHNEKRLGFGLKEFLLTAHANRNRTPGKFFDQGGNGTAQARTNFSVPEPVALFKSNLELVTKNERIEECSRCHNYALVYPQFQDKIAQGKFPGPQVGCGACHDSHIPGPRDPVSVSSTVMVTGLSGTTVTAVTPVQGRSVSYLNHKPYKINESEAKDDNGLWTRGSDFARPNIAIVKGIGTLSSSPAVAEHLTFPGGGFLRRVKPFDTLFISGQASATVNLPADAVDAGAPVTVQATLDMAGFEVEEVIDDNTIAIKPRTITGAAGVQAIAQLGTDQVAVVAQAAVTYNRAQGTGTLNVFVPFIGQFNFDIRDMYLNTEDLCGSCHTQGTLKFSAQGRKRDGTFIDVSKTHNNDIMGQYLQSGHRRRTDPPFEEFSAFVFGSSHQAIYPFDQSITGSGGLNSLRNKGNRTFQLTQTPNPQRAFLARAGVTTQPVPTTTSLTCNQCHHGLGTIDFMEDRHGTPEAQVLWGDSTHTCFSCHDPHKNEAEDKNVRKPVKLSYNSRFVDAVKNPRGGVDLFMDGTLLPTTLGNTKLCLFCHQGRESGLTVFLAIKNQVDPYTNPDQVINIDTGVSFVNPHYLDGGSILWSRNAWEFFFNGVPQSYTTGNSNHQQLNCTGCHMGEASPNNFEGGHTWRPRVETCQQCHGQITQFEDIVAFGDYDGDGTVRTTFEEIGTIAPDGSSGTGLFGQVVAALNGKGIFYNPNSYPYFFTSRGAQFRAFTPNTLAASFNLAWAYKSGACVYWHNAKYVVQILHDSLRALGVTPTGVRPTGNRSANDYRVLQNNINP